MRRVALLVFACLPLLASPAAAAPGPLSEVLVDVIEDAQPVRDVLRRLEARHGLNYVVSEEVLAKAGTVTVRLRQVPLDDALHAICSACGLTLEIRGSILIMHPRTPSGRRTLPSVKEGVLPKHARERAFPDAPPPQRRTVLGTPTPDPALNAVTAVGTVKAVDMKQGRLQLEDQGLVRDLYLPPETDQRSSRLRIAMGRMKPGFRVALRYSKVGARSVILDLVGGDQVRDAQVPMRHRRRRARRGDKSPVADAKKPRLDPAPRADQPDPKPAPATPKPSGPPGVIAGKFVKRDGDQVQIKTIDGTVVTTYLPGEEGLRAKVEAVLEGLNAGNKLYMTVKQIDGKSVLQGGMSERK